MCNKIDEYRTARCRMCQDCSLTDSVAQLIQLSSLRTAVGRPRVAVIKPARVPPSHESVALTTAFLWQRIYNLYELLSNTYCTDIFHAIQTVSWKGRNYLNLLHLTLYLSSSVTNYAGESPGLILSYAIPHSHSKIS